MNHRESFFRAIHAAPDDPHPKRVFADWLEEQGEGEMAEYIRLRCEREAMQGQNPSDREWRLGRAESGTAPLPDAPGQLL